ncbi:hypothetical protein B0T25DRAFT_634562 [Lasiosphaeria hispida]|uniref:Nephrocystin 3-like N-terminal domain-containing protein n=1 Tax=Lasiosphaeria hispida TaxID=260671 RepID=A0AAJ0M9E0_9PEZI|nr:hypothetical protein B0T25DRAFT_634562 [Lasiosphaeria hispida]
MTSPPPRTSNRQPATPVSPTASHNPTANAPMAPTSTLQRIGNRSLATYLTETDYLIRHCIYKMGDSSFAEAPEITGLESYLQHIGDERLRRMPPPGSDWDRILHAAQLFALQLWGLGCAANDPNVTDTASTRALTTTQTLLMLGLLQTRTLLPTFQVFYQLSIMLSHTSRIHGTAQAKDDVTRLYSAVVALVDAVAVFYRVKLTLVTRDQDKTIDFESSFGTKLDKIWECHRDIMSKMWLPKLNERDPDHSARLGQVHRQLKPEWSERDVFYERVTANLAYAGNTCGWFEPHLIDFLDGDQKVLAITGGPGSGKTFLAEWIEERLLRPLDYEDDMCLTLTYAFPFDSRAECTQLSFLKGMLLQLFEKRIGQMEVYTKLADAFKEHTQRPDTQKLELFLWAALASALEALDRDKTNFVLILDGIDRITDQHGHPASGFYPTLLKITSKLQTSHLITLSEVAPLGGIKDSHFGIPSEDLAADIEAYFRHSLTHHDWLSDQDRDNIVRMLARKPDAIPFLWARFMVRLLQLSNDTSREGFLRTAGSISGLSLDDTLKRLIPDQLLKEDTTRRILSFMLVAHRPPTVAEVSELMGVDVANLRNKVTLDVRNHVSTLCSDIVVIRHGALHFRNETTRKYVQARMGMGGSRPAEKDAHRELALALLLYAKLILEHNDITIPSSNLLDSETTSRLTSFYPLLRYAVTYWQSHLRKSGFDTDVEPGSLRDVLPRSYRFALLQWDFWQGGSSASRLAEDFAFFLHIQEACFTKDDLFILQTLVILAIIYRTDGKHFNAAEYYYRAAACLAGGSEDNLSFFSTFVMTCAESYLQCISSLETETMDEYTRKDIATRQQEMIRLLIKISIMTYGPSSDYVEKWYEALAKLYISFQRFSDAAEVGREYGKVSNEHPGGKGRSRRLVRRIYDHLEELKFEFATDSVAPEARNESYETFLIGIRESLGHMEINRQVTYLLQVATSHESRKEWDQAEDTYVQLWKLIRIEFDKSPPPSTELQENKIRVGIQYAQFLQDQGRGPEAADILILLWNEHNRYSWDQRSIVILFRKTGFRLRTLGRLEIAALILTKVWEGDIVERDDKLEVTIQEITEEITKTTTDRELMTKVTTLESILERRRKSGTVDDVFFGTTLILANRYMKQEEWTDAERILEETLRVTWAAFLPVTTQEPVALPEHHVSWCVRVAVCLADYYDRRGFTDRAESTWLRASHPCRAASNMEEGEARILFGALAQFCHWQNYYESVSHTFYSEIFSEYRNRLGSSDKLVIGVLYDLAAYSQRLGRRSDAYKYYMEIVTTLNEGLNYCHPDAYTAEVELLGYYRRKGFWKEVKRTCEMLWKAFVHHHQEIKFAQNDVQTIYDDYIYVLERDDNSSDTMYRISIEFRDTVKTVFEPDDLIVPMAKIAVAAVCEGSQRYTEAAEAYEELIKTTEITKATRQKITESKQRLSTVYITIITSDSSTLVEAKTIRRAVELCEETYAQFRIDRDCWDKETLNKLQLIIILLLKLGDADSAARTTELLREAFRDVVTSDCSAQSLYDAAEALAPSFMNLRDLGLDFVFQVRHWSVFGQLPSRAPGGVKLNFRPGTEPNEKCYVFLVAFEQRLSERDLAAFSELMAADRQESTLYEQYQAARDADKGTPGRDSTILARGAKLQGFWVEHEQTQMSQVLEKELFTFFKETYTPLLRTKDSSFNDIHTRVFLLQLLITLRGLEVHNEAADFGTLVCQAGNAAVHDLLDRRQFGQVLEVAECAFNFANQHGFYKDQRHVPYAFSLAEIMAGIGINKPPNAELEIKYLGFSKQVTTTAMRILEEINIDIIRLSTHDHKGIIRLLGYQKNYKVLQSHLHRLWTSTLTNPNVPLTLLSLSRLYIHAHAAASDLASAITVCRTITHNLQHSRGPLDSVTISLQEILSSLYSAKGSFRLAIKIHEDVLRQIESAAGSPKPHTHWDRTLRGLRTTAQGVAKVVDKKALAETAGRNLKLLMYAYARKGDWAGRRKGLDEACARLQGCLDHQVKPLPQDLPVYRDGLVLAGDRTGVYVPPRDEEWVIDGEGLEGADYVEAAGMIWGWVCEVKGRGVVG